MVISEKSSQSYPHTARYITDGAIDSRKAIARAELVIAQVEAEAADAEEEARLRVESRPSDSRIRPKRDKLGGYGRESGWQKPL